MISVAFWLIAGLVMIGTEMLIPGFTIFFFGLGALAVSLLSAIIPGLESHPALQSLIWAIASVSSFALFRKKLAKFFLGSIINPDNGSQNDIGKKAKVIEAISPDSPGRIRFQGTSWTAQSYNESFKPGDMVEIIQREGLMYIVTSSISGELPDVEPEGNS